MITFSGMPANQGFGLTSASQRQTILEVTYVSEKAWPRAIDSDPLKVNALRRREVSALEATWYRYRLRRFNRYRRNPVCPRSETLRRSRRGRQPGSDYD